VEVDVVGVRQEVNATVLNLWFVLTGQEMLAFKVHVEREGQRAGTDAEAPLSG